MEEQQRTPKPKASWLYAPRQPPRGGGLGDDWLLLAFLFPGLIAAVAALILVSEAAAIAVVAIVLVVTVGRVLLDGL